jgi:hypothetical protein
MTPPGETIAATPAHDVTFPADKIAGVKVLDVGSNFDNLSTKFVTDDQRHVNHGLCPLVPVVDVQVGAANSRAKHANLHVVDAGFGLGNIFEPETPLSAAFNKGLHSGSPPAKSAGSAKSKP